MICNNSLLTTKKTNKRGTKNNGVGINASVKKQESNNNLSAMGSRQAPRNVFELSNRAKKPSIRSVIQAKRKKKNALPHQDLIIEPTIIGITTIREIVNNVGKVMRFSAAGNRLNTGKVNRDKLIFFTAPLSSLQPPNRI